MEPLSWSDFLYAKTSEGKWVALYKGKVESVRSNIFTGSWYDDDGNHIMSWGTIHNPPGPPTEVPHNPVQFTESFTLTFENTIPKSWMDMGFHLEYEGIKFIIESFYRSKDGEVLTTAVSI